MYLLECLFALELLKNWFVFVHRTNANQIKMQKKKKKKNEKGEQKYGDLI